MSQVPLDALPTPLKFGADGYGDPELDTGLRLFMVSSLVGAGSIWMGSFGAPVRREPHLAEPWARRVAQHGNCADTLVGLNPAKKQEKLPDL